MSASYLNIIESEINKSIDENKQAIDYFDLSVRNLYDGDFKKAEENILKYKSIINYDSLPKYDRRFLEYPELSVIIVAYNTGDTLVDCIESLLNNNAGNYEIIVVDNGGNENVVEKLLGFKLLYISSPHNFGCSEGRNIGAYFAKGNILAFLDDDDIVGKSYVKNIVKPFGKYNLIGLRGKILPKSDHYNNKIAAGHYDLGGNDKFIRYINAEANCAFSKKEYIKLNGMNPLLFGHEGIELSYRIEKFYEFKKILYSPEIIIYHDFAYSDFKLDIKEKRHKIMMSYLQFLHPDIEDFITDIDYCNSDIRSNMKTSFSIIMPTYNRKQCIKNAIDSLLTQTYKNFELIIVDDGSTDGTDLYLKEIYKEEINNKKIKYFKLPENKGAAFARNFGIRKAKNKWIGYLDTDNQMHNDFLETFADSIKASAHEIYYAQTKPRKSQIIFGSAFNFDELVQFNLIDLGVFIHSVQIYKELGGFDVSLNRAIDWDLIIKYTEKYPPKFIEKILLDYDDNPESSRISNNESFNEAYKQVILNYYKRIPPEKFIEKYTGRNIQHSQTGNEWLSSQREAWEKAAAEREQSIIALKAYIQDLQTGNAWLSSQREAWEKAAAEREQSIAVLQSQVQDLQTGNAWLSSQREAWEKAAAEREQVIAALQSQGRDLQTGNAWLLSQREAWEKVAAERKFILDKIRNHWGMRFVNFLSKTKLF